MERTPGGHLLLHADHELEYEHLHFIDRLLADWDGTFISLHEELPELLLPLTSALYGPRCGDLPVLEHDVEYITRGDRAGPSRMVDRPMRSVRKMVLIAGPSAEHGPCIYTAFGSQYPSPREWWDPSMRPLDAMVSSSFWVSHALSKKMLP